MASTTETAVAPKDWPREADDDFRRIRVLGRGAFGEVWLAQRRDDPNSNNPSSTTPNNDYVAIKGVSINSDKKGRTASREIAILKELCHPNIIRLVRDFQPASPTAEGRYFALAYVNKGKDVGDLLEKRGALPIALAQLIARHLIAAVAYLHVRGVMHRDIKPDNIMLENWSDDMMWADEEIYKQSVESGRFKAILVDFGFARATRRDDYDGTERENVIRRTSSSFFKDDYDNIESDEEEEIVERRTSFNYDAPQRSTHFVNPAELLQKDTVARRISSRRRSRLLTNSRMASRIVFRAMSAVGTKHFAAPEITQSIRRGSHASKALTEFVSSYSLISDAYAVGATLSELLTGVPPGQDVESYVKSNRKVPPKDILEPKKSGFLCCSSTADAVVASQELQPSTGSICLRFLNELPVPAKDLIVALMQESADDRLSVRNAQEHEWIGGYDMLPHGDQPSRLDDPIVFVKNEDAFVV
jgi:serine/threonine protein kinase